jgi:hypothetical protein
MRYDQSVRRIYSYTLHYYWNHIDVWCQLIIHSPICNKQEVFCGVSGEGVLMGWGDNPPIPGLPPQMMLNMAPPEWQVIYDTLVSQ